MAANETPTVEEDADGEVTARVDVDMKPVVDEQAIRDTPENDAVQTLPKPRLSTSASHTHSQSRSTVVVARRRSQQRLWPVSRRALTAYPDHNALGQRRMKRLDTLSHAELLVLQALVARARPRANELGGNNSAIWRSHPFLTRQRDVLVTLLSDNDSEGATSLLRDLLPPEAASATANSPRRSVDGNVQKTLQLDYPAWRKRYFQKPIDQRMGLRRSAFLRLFPKLQTAPHASQKQIFAVFDGNATGKVEFTELCETLVRCSGRMRRHDGEYVDDDDRIAVVFEWFMEKHALKITGQGIRLLEATLLAVQSTQSEKIASTTLRDTLLNGQASVGFDDFYDRLRKLPQVVESLMAPFEIITPLLGETAVLKLHEKTQWQAGDAAYVVEATWWRRWVSSVQSKRVQPRLQGNQETDCSTDDATFSPVGPVSNGVLCDVEVDGVLKPGLQLTQDFVLVSGAVWSKLRLLFGGGPEIARKIVVKEEEKEPNQDGQDHEDDRDCAEFAPVDERLRVHLYPMVLFIRLMKTDSTKTSLLLARQFKLPAKTLLKDLLHRMGLSPGVNVQSVSFWVRRHRWDVWRRIERSLEDPGASLTGVRMQSGCELIIDFKVALSSTSTARQLFSDDRLHFSLYQPIGNDYVCRGPGIQCALSLESWQAQAQSAADEAGNKYEKEDAVDGQTGEVYTAGHSGLVTNSGLFVNLNEQLKLKKKKVVPRLLAGGIDGPTDGGSGVRTTGLLNMGNTCFLSCAIQCISHSPMLREYFLSQRFLQDINKVNPLGTKGKIAGAYGKLMDSLWSELKDSESCFAPAGFRDEFARHRTQFQESSQHDAHEFMVSLLDSLHEDLNRKRGGVSTPRRSKGGSRGLLCMPFFGPGSSSADTQEDDNVSTAAEEDSTSTSSSDEVVGSAAWQAHARVNSSVVVDLFHGQMRSETVCLSCDERKATFDPFLFVSVPIPEPKFLRVEVKIILQVRPSSGKTESALEAFTPTRQGFWLARTGTVADLCVEISHEYRFDARRFVIVEVRHNRIKRIFDDTDTLEAITPFRDLYAFERAWSMDDIPLTPSLVAACVDEPSDDVFDAENAQVNSFSELHVGSRVDGVGFHNDWHPGSVVGVSEGPKASSIDRVVSPDTGIDADPVKLNRVLVHFDAFSSKWDKWFSADDWEEGNVAPVHSKTTRSVEVFEVQVVHRRMLASQKASYSHSVASRPYGGGGKNSSVLEVFGVPMFVTIASDRTAHELHGAILLQASRFIPGFETQLNDDAATMEMPYDVRVVDLDDASALLGEALPNDSSCILQHFATQSVVVLDWKGSVYADSELQAKDRIPEEMAALEKEHATSNNSESILSNSTSLNSCLEALFKAEDISLDDHWNCERCGVKRAGTRRSDVWKLPDLVMIQLKRFQYQENGFRQKVRTMVDFPLHGLDFSQWMGREGSGNHGDAEDPACLYDLYAVANHVGGLARGHYTAYCKYDSDFDESARVFSTRERDRHHRGGAAELVFDDVWYRFDDEKVVEIAPADVVTEAAYVLFYKRRKLSPHNVLAYAM